MIAPATSPKVRDYLSYSAISTYRTCSLRYFFRYVAGLPDETVSASLVFGAAIDRAIEHHFRELLAGMPPPSLDELLAQYQEEWQERDPNAVKARRDDPRSTLDETARKLLERFQADGVARPDGVVLGVEEELREAIIPHAPDFLGRIDLIVETPEELVISDWKSSRSRWSPDQVEDAAEQLLLYSELARDFAPGKPTRIELVVLTKTKEPSIERYSMPVDPVRVDRTKRLVARVWSAIEAGHFFPSPSLMNCGGCPFREPCRKWPG